MLVVQWFYILHVTHYYELDEAITAIWLEFFVLEL